MHALRRLLTGILAGLVCGGALVGGAQQPQTRIEQFLIRTQGASTGVTAATTQTQGQGAITTSIVQVSTVGTANDVVTLPTAVAGDQVFIINDGANVLQIFPASGDNLGTGLNLSTTLEPAESVIFVAYDATNWELEASTEIIHAEMFDFNNTDAYVINDGGSDQQAYHTNGLVAGDLSGWTFDAGGAGTSFPIASVADGVATGVDIEVTTTGTHGLAAGDIVSQSNLANAAYVGFFVVKAIISTTEYEVAAVFTATGTGTMDQAATLIADVGSAGQYLVSYSASGTAAANNDVFDFAVHVEAAHQTSTNAQRKFAVGADIGAWSNVSIITIADGDHVSFMVNNDNASSGDITIRDFTLVLVRL